MLEVNEKFVVEVIDAKDVLNAPAITWAEFLSMISGKTQQEIAEEFENETTDR